MLIFIFDYKAAANSHASNYLIKYAISNLIKSFYSVDAVSDVEDFDDEEDLGRKLHQLRYDLYVLHSNIRIIHSISLPLL